MCANAGGFVLWRSDLCRVIRVDDPFYPGFCRVIWNDHVREMTDLDAAHQA
ncbi:MAG: HIT domain-containing protein, partial [Azonexus sp.]